MIKIYFIKKNRLALKFATSIFFVELVIFVIPILVYAQTPISAKQLVNNFNKFLLNPFIILLFAVALLVFFWGLFQFMRSASAGSADMEDGKKHILWGIIGLFIMTAVFGIINLLLKSLGIETIPF